MVCVEYLQHIEHWLKLIIPEGDITANTTQACYRVQPKAENYNIHHPHEDNYTYLTASISSLNISTKKSRQEEANSELLALN